MASVLSKVEDLFSLRTEEVRELIRPLRPQPTIHCQFYKYALGGGKILAIHDGANPESHYDDWRCRTFVDEIWCQYYEWWKPMPGGERDWYLDRAYLHLYEERRPALELKQILCIHSDPYCNDATPLNKFKSGPHLHLMSADSPLPDCHFPLNLGHLKTVLSSRKNLTDAIGDAVGIICSDVLPRIAKEFGVLAP